ncbi:MAG: MFS transporter [Oscillospiraceae bacterium]|nr:MFS transporter [Oscillospiraceae bacterium]
MKLYKIHELKSFLILWSTQSFSQLGSSVTAFALTLWLYEKTGSSLSTAALTICSYLPYVLMSIFAGAVTDRFDKKKTMLVCDAIAGLCTITVYIIYRTDNLLMWHLYAVNAFSGFMNTVQQPASEVASTLLVPKKYYQKTSGLQSLSRSLISILNPLIATALYSLAGLDIVIMLDLFSFVAAFTTLMFFIKIPAVKTQKSESIFKLAGDGIRFLIRTPMIFYLILFMSGVNLIASAFDAVLPGLVIPNPRGGTGILGIVTSCSGIAMIIGSLIISFLPKPANRVRVVYLTMLFSLGTENFIMAFSREPFLWCIGQIIGWILVPVMSGNLDVILRNTIPVELQGRVYACRNTFQFFTIPIGLFFGGFLVDNVCEPFMAGFEGDSILNLLFGTGKSSGAALVMFLLGVSGVTICLLTGLKLRKYTYNEN